MAIAGPDPLIPDAIAPDAIIILLILRASLSPVEAATAIPLDDRASRVEPFMIDARDLSKIGLCSIKESDEISIKRRPLRQISTDKL